MMKLFPVVQDVQTTRDRIEWLYGLQHFGIKLGLDNIRRLLEMLGRPDRLFPSLLVAGTNGKGSVAAMLHAMLEASEVPAGLFTSPHLVRPHERIRVRDDDIDDPTLQRTLGDLRKVIESAVASGELECHPSFFEVITAAALCVFRERELGAAVLEVGLGGRLDATNVVEADVSVVVGIDLDHTKTLGSTIEQIAKEKAGIVKHGRPVVSGVSRQRAIDVLSDVCREREATLVHARQAVRLVHEGPDGFTLQSDRGRYERLQLSLAGRHQLDNAVVALAAFECFMQRTGHEIDPDAVRRGLASVRWPGRLEWWRDDAGEMLFDGAHNPSGMQTLAGYLTGRGGPQPVGLIGAMRGKLLPEMLAELAPHVETVVITRPSVRRAAEPDEVAAVAREHVARVEIVPEPAAALALARQLAGRDRFVLVTGSLYLVGEVMGLLTNRATPGPVSM